MSAVISSFSKVLVTEGTEHNSSPTQKGPNTNVSLWRGNEMGREAPTLPFNKIITK